MARNGSGTYSKVNTFVSGNTITASGHNANWDDIATEMTNSVAADGQTSMTGPFKLSNGTVSAPSITFASDPDSGLYRIGANNLGLALGGSKVIDFATTGIAITGTLGASSDFAINTNKFTVTASSGNTSVAGTLGVTGAATFSSTLSVTGDVAVNTNKFNVTASSGNTTVAGTLGVTGAATLSSTLSVTSSITGASVAGNMVATQSDQETGSSTTTIVSPGRQQFHPSAAKFWIMCDVAGNINASYNITSITDAGTGLVTITIATDFSSANYAIVSGFNFGDAAAGNDSVHVLNTTQAAGSFQLIMDANNGTNTDPVNYYSVGFGDQ